MDAQELLVERQPMLASLQEERWGKARERAHERLVNELRYADEIDNPTPALRYLQYIGASVDDSILTVKSLFELDAIGVDYQSMLKQSANSDTAWQQTVTVSGLSIVISPLDNGITYTLNGSANSQNPHANTPAELIENIYVKRIENSPPFLAIHSLREQLYTAATASVMSEPFQIYEDALGMLTVLESLGFPALSATSIKMDLSENTTPEEILNKVLASAPEQVQQPLSGEDYQFVWCNDKVWYVLYVNVQTGQAAIEVRVDTREYYTERANRSAELATPFIDTACAAEIAQILTDNGLKFSDDISQEITRIGEADRFGSVYTQLSREVAKWVNNEEHINITKLFLPQNTQYYFEDLVDKEKIANVLIDLDCSSYSEPTAILFGLIKEALLARNTTRDSKLSVTKACIIIRDDACFDVTSYHIKGAALPASQDGVVPYEEEGVPMLAQSYGAITYLLLKPTLFNGVNLPKGSLMKKLPDDTWAFLRLTSFSFDTDEDAKVFEAEILKAKSKNPEAVKKLAGLSPGSNGYDLAGITAGAVHRAKQRAKNIPKIFA